MVEEGRREDGLLLLQAVLSQVIKLGQLLRRRPWDTSSSVEVEGGYVREQQQQRFRLPSFLSSRFPLM